MKSSFKWSNDFKRMMKQTEKLGEGMSVPLDELFPSAFMLNHSQSDNIYSFFEKGGFNLTDNASLERIDEEKLDQYVREQTDFSSWDELKGKAGAEYAVKFLGL